MKAKRKRSRKRNGRETELPLPCGGRWARLLVQTLLGQIRLSWESREARSEGGGRTRGEGGRGSVQGLLLHFRGSGRPLGWWRMLYPESPLGAEVSHLTQLTFWNHLSPDAPPFLSLQLLRTLFSMGANCGLAPVGLGVRVSAHAGGDEMLRASPPFSLPLNHLSEGPFPPVHSVTR